MCMIPGHPEAHTFEMTEDPEWMKEHKQPVALYYYVSSFRTSLEQLFEVEGAGMKHIRLLFDDAEDIAWARNMGKTFCGVWTRFIQCVVIHENSNSHIWSWVYYQKHRLPVPLYYSKTITRKA